MSCCIYLLFFVKCVQFSMPLFMEISPESFSVFTVYEWRNMKDCCMSEIHHFLPLHVLPGRCRHQETPESVWSTVFRVTLPNISIINRLLYSAHRFTSCCSTIMCLPELFLTTDVQIWGGHVVSVYVPVKVFKNVQYIFWMKSNSSSTKSFIV